MGLCKEFSFRIERIMAYDLKFTSQVSKAWEDTIGAQNLTNTKEPTNILSSEKHWY